MEAAPIGPQAVEVVGFGVWELAENVLPDSDPTWVPVPGGD